MEMTVYRATRGLRVCAREPLPTRRACTMPLPGVGGKRYQLPPSKALKESGRRPSSPGGRERVRPALPRDAPHRAPPEPPPAVFSKGTRVCGGAATLTQARPGCPRGWSSLHRACKCVKSSLRGYSSQTLTCTTLSVQRSGSPHHSGQGAGRFQVPGTPGAPRGLRCLQITAVGLKGTPARPSVPGESERWVWSVCSHGRTATPQAVGDRVCLVSALIPKGASNLLACDQTPSVSWVTQGVGVHWRRQGISRDLLNAVSPGCTSRPSPGARSLGAGSPQRRGLRGPQISGWGPRRTHGAWGGSAGEEGSTASDGCRGAGHPITRQTAQGPPGNNRAGGLGEAPAAAAPPLSQGASPKSA